MSWKKWSRFSPRVALLLAVATAVPLAALLWVGWRALEQDRALENEQIRQQVERAADIVAAALQRAYDPKGYDPKAQIIAPDSGLEILLRLTRECTVASLASRTTV
jgi:hypothetical protein